MNTGFKPNFKINNAIDEIIKAYDNSLLTDKDEWHTVKWMKQLNIK